MGRTIIMHLDDAPWIRGGPRGQGDSPDGGGQFIGDKQQGPWIHANWLPGGLVAPPHSHSHDEIMYVLEGGFDMGDRKCGPGTVLFIEGGTEYGFTVWEQGVRFLNIRPGLATIRFDGEPENPYDS